MSQTLPDFALVLTPEELLTFSKYSHSAPKTTYESFLVKGPLRFIERLFPDFLSANALTLMGQLPIVSYMFYAFIQISPDISLKNQVDPTWFLGSAILLQWFSLVDIMDGMRARRLKVGSPMGRLIDEAGDCIVMTAYSILCAYVLVLENSVLEIIYFFMNMAFYGMEIKFYVTGSLVMLVGELSSVEVELTLSSILFFAWYFGCQGLQDTVAQKFELSEDSLLATIGDNRLATIIGAIITLTKVLL